MSFIEQNIIETYTQYNKYVRESIITATLLLMSLAWNDLMQEIVNYYYPSEDKQGIKGKLIYASIITLIIILLQIYIFPYIKN